MSKVKDYGEYLRQLFLKGQGIITQRRGPAVASTRKFYSFHPGYDIGVKEGTPIYAPFSGVTIFSGLHGGYGQRLGIYDPASDTTYYLSHLSQIKAPKTFKAGDLLALTGGAPGKWYSGNTTGPHVDIESYRGKKIPSQVISKINQIIPKTKKIYTNLLRDLAIKYGAKGAAKVGSGKENILRELAKKYGGKIIRITI